VADTQDDEEGFYLEGPDLLQLCRDAVSHLEIA
jgi:hypothetical protein